MGPAGICLRSKRIMNLSSGTASKSCCLLLFWTCTEGEVFGITCHGGRVSVACVEVGSLAWAGPQ